MKSCCLKVSQRMRLLRQKDCRTQSSLAGILGVSSRCYSYYESGNCEHSILFLIKFADYYDVTLDYLCGLTDNPKGYRFPESICYVPATKEFKLSEIV